MSKICCGGFELGEGLELDGKKLKVSESGGSSTVAHFVVEVTTSSGGGYGSATVTAADKTVAEVREAMKTMPVIGIAKYIVDGEDYGEWPLGSAMGGLPEVIFGLLTYQEFVCAIYSITEQETSEGEWAATYPFG